jgi:hypothetical protein
MTPASGSLIHISILNFTYKYLDAHFDLCLCRMDQRRQAGGEDDAAAVWGHAVKDCGVTITSRTGEPQTEIDFSAERD